MSRHIGNLERLHSKLAVRYGTDDELVLQLKRELDLLKTMKSERKDNSTANAIFIGNKAPAMQNQYLNI